MKRERRVIWSQLLLIGLINVLIGTGCNKEVDKVEIVEYVYKNNCTHPISITTFNSAKDSTYLIDISQSLILNDDLSTGNTFNNYLIVNSDSVKIVNVLNQAINFYPESQSSRNIIHLENYEYSKVTKNHHEYNYTLSDSDFD